MPPEKPTQIADASIRTPAAEYEVTPDLVRALLGAQHSEFADLEIKKVSEGWDNIMFRLGSNLCARMPRRAVAEDLLRTEQLWLAKLADRLPVPIPVPIRRGRPQFGYPWIWSVVGWMPGEPVSMGRLGEDQGPALARFLRALHVPAPADAPKSDCRGGPLTTRADLVLFRSKRLEGQFPELIEQVGKVWQSAIDAPAEFDPVFLHGDLHPRNVLMEAGRLSAVIDWGDMCGGDPATDLAALWMLLPSPAARKEAITIYKPSPACLLRAKGWAITWGLLLLDTGMEDHDENAHIGRTILDQVLLG